MSVGWPLRFLGSVAVLSAFCWLAAGAADAADACGGVDWLCVSECADSECMEGCMGKGCAAATRKYAACTRAACSQDDTECGDAAASCGELCRAAFGSRQDVGAKGRWSCPRRANGGVKDSLPESALGLWVLDGASIPPAENSVEDDAPPAPRPDFRRRLNLLADDCFALESVIEDPSLGPGNQITVRLMGHLKYRGGKLTLTPEAREAESSLCSVPAIRPLPDRAMTVKSYEFQREGDELTLTDTGADRQVLHYARAPSPKASEPGVGQP